jgi:histidyl-tRNA synthetase
MSVLEAHGYREVQPSPIEPSGTGARAGGHAVPLGSGSELSCDPLVSMARLFAGTNAEVGYGRWMSVGHVFQPAPPDTARAWPALAGMLFGTDSPAADGEMAALALAAGSDLALRRFEVALGTLGESADLERFLQATADLRARACPRCRAREAEAPLHFLSCADDGCRALAETGPALRDFISIDSLKHHEAVLATLEASGFEVHDDPRLGFGAGRFARTIFELRARTANGQVVAVGRGGRRDDLVATFGGRPWPAVGITLGIAQLASCTPGEPLDPSGGWHLPIEVFIVAEGTAARAWALKAAAVERARGFRVEVDLRDVDWAQHRARAEELRARVLLVVGEAERKQGQVAILDLASGTRRHIAEERLTAELKRLVR